MALADQIRALTFDVFGTVVDWRSSIAAEAERLLRPKGIDADWIKFAEGWRARYEPAMQRVRSGDRGFVKLDRSHRENLLDLLGEFDISGLSEDEIDDLNQAWHRLTPWPDAVVGLERLKRRYILATLSNGNVALIVNMAKHAGLPWDVVLGAEVARAYKPKPQAYQNAAEMLSLDPAQCLMVAAHNDDLHAAAGQGFATAFVARRSEYGPDQTKDLAADASVDLAATSFLDLADQLGC